LDFSDIVSPALASLRSRRVARGNANLVAVVMNLGLAEDLAVIAFKRYPRDQEAVGLGAAAKRKRDRIAYRDPRWQAYVVIGPMRTRDQPIDSLGQHAAPARPDGIDGVRLGSGADTRDDHHQAGDPQAMRARPSKLPGSERFTAHGLPARAPRKIERLL